MGGSGWNHEVGVWQAKIWDALDVQDELGNL